MKTAISIAMFFASTSLFAANMEDLKAGDKIQILSSTAVVDLDSAHRHPHAAMATQYDDSDLFIQGFVRKKIVTLDSGLVATVIKDGECQANYLAGVYSYTCTIVIQIGNRHFGLFQSRSNGNFDAAAIFDNVSRVGSISASVSTGEEAAQ